MNILIVFITCLSLNLHQDIEIPYLGEQYFSYELDYSFQKKTTSSSTEIDMVRKQPKILKITPLPYVRVNLVLRDLDNRILKYKIIDNYGKTRGTKKVKILPIKIEIDMGFGEDIKDRTGPHQFILTLIDDNKNIDSRVVFEFDEEGNMMVNGVLSGKI